MQSGAPTVSVRSSGRRSRTSRNMPATRPLFILPDFGRDADEDAGGNGFQHHRTGDAASRTTWMMALGAGVRAGRGLRPSIAVDRSCPNSRRHDGILCLQLSQGNTDPGVVVTMLPRDLKAEQFAGYPPKARELAVAHLAALRQLPLSFAAKPAARSYRLRLQISRRARLPSIRS